MTMFDSLIHQDHTKPMPILDDAGNTIGHSFPAVYDIDNHPLLQREDIKDILINNRNDIFAMPLVDSTRVTAFVHEGEWKVVKDDASELSEEEIWLYLNASAYDMEFLNLFSDSISFEFSIVHRSDTYHYSPEYNSMLDTYGVDSIVFCNGAFDNSLGTYRDIDLPQQNRLPPSVFADSTSVEIFVDLCRDVAMPGTVLLIPSINFWIKIDSNQMRSYKKESIMHDFYGHEEKEGTNRYDVRVDFDIQEFHTLDTVHNTAELVLEKLKDRLLAVKWVRQTEEIDDEYFRDMVCRYILGEDITQLVRIYSAS